MRTRILFLLIQGQILRILLFRTFLLGLWQIIRSRWPRSIKLKFNITRWRPYYSSFFSSWFNQPQKLPQFLFWFGPCLLMIGLSNFRFLFFLHLKASLYLLILTFNSFVNSLVSLQIITNALDLLVFWTRFFSCVFLRLLITPISFGFIGFFSFSFDFLCEFLLQFTFIFLGNFIPRLVILLDFLFSDLVPCLLGFCIDRLIFSGFLIYAIVFFVRCHQAFPDLLLFSFLHLSFRYNSNQGLAPGHHT